ncbi:MAG: hypothetical protein GY862_09365 [Gammaproteobacteria bacterium]|nr:hypothetical protein [Gammaproteobacteria bacterium]
MTSIILVPALRAEPDIRRSALFGVRQPGKDERMQRGAHNHDVPRRVPARDAQRRALA